MFGLEIPASQLLYSTVLVTALLANGGTSTGTAFFYEFDMGEQRAVRGGSGCLDSFWQFISGAWRCTPTRQWAVQAGCHSTRDRVCVRQAHDAA